MAKAPTTIRQRMARSRRLSRNNSPLLPLDVPLLLPRSSRFTSPSSPRSLHPISERGTNFTPSQPVRSESTHTETTKSSLQKTMLSGSSRSPMDFSNQTPTHFNQVQSAAHKKMEKQFRRLIELSTIVLIFPTALSVLDMYPKK